MLKVTDEGIQIALQPQLTTAFPYQEALILVAVTFINGILGFGLSLYSQKIAILINLILLILVYFMYQRRLKKQPKRLSGGDLTLSNQQFIHHVYGTTTQYQLQTTDTIQSTGDTLMIKNQQDEILYKIQGFSEKKHLEVAHAVLNGKTIQTQAKAIRLQS